MKIEQNLVDNLSSCIVEDETKDEILIMQPYLINCLTDKFCNDVKDMTAFKTPGTPRFKIVPPSHEIERIDLEK